MLSCSVQEFMLSCAPRDCQGHCYGFRPRMPSMRLVLYSWLERAKAEAYCGEDDSCNSCHGSPGVHKLCLLEPAQATFERVTPHTKNDH